MGGIWSAFVGLMEQLLLWCAQITGSVGFGIILFTVFARLAILPLSLSSIRSSRKLQQVQPLIKEVQRKYGKDQQKLQEETLRIYREYKINPVGGCLPLFLQLPIFFAVYQAVYHLMIPEQRVNLSAAAKAMLENPVITQMFSNPFFGLELGKATWGPAPLGFNGAIYLLLPVLSIALQLIQQVMATPRTQDPQQKAMTQAMMFMPIVFGYIAFTFPSGAVLYWVTSSVIGIVQQYFTSGWGSLANYLKFLPVEEQPIHTANSPALATVGANGVVTVDAVPAEPHHHSPPRDFWGVMRPLTELEVPGGNANDDVSDSPSNAAQVNLRKSRRRR